MKKDLTLFEEAKKSNLLLHGGVSTILSFLMVFVGQLIGGFFIILIGMLRYGTDYALENFMDLLFEPMGLVLAFIFPLLLCYLWVSIIEKRGFSTIGLQTKKFLVPLLKGFGLGILLFSVVALLAYLFGAITLKQGIDIGVKPLAGILIILPSWILQSSAEEIIIRGWLMHVVGARHTPLVGFLVSSITFGFLHIFNQGIDVLFVINIVLFGLFLGLYVIYTQDLWGACGIHAAWNFAQSNLFGFSVSGLEANSDSLLKFSNTGSDFLTGGKFGPEASIFTSVVVLFMIVILVQRVRKQGFEF